MNKKIIGILGAVALLATLGAGCSAGNQNANTNTITNAPSEPAACTMEAKLCPDGSAVGRTGPNCEFAPCPGENQPTTAALSEAEARVIAEKSCIKGGEALKAGSYNEITKTWWFDANLNATREGCNPACVVFEETKTAEINWRCTGLIVGEEGIMGSVLQGPTCPVVRNPPDPGCADKPYADAEVTATSAVGKQYKGQTDATGKFSIVVPAGTYTVTVAPVNILPRCEEKQNVVVEAGNFTSVDISCDTGIR